MAEDDLTHYVKGSLKQRGYYRKKPFIYDLPSMNQRKTRALFGKIAHIHGRGEFGKQVIVDKHGVEKEIPASAVPIMENMQSVAPPTPVSRVVFVSPLERLRKLTEILASLEQAT